MGDIELANIQILDDPHGIRVQLGYEKNQRPFGSILVTSYPDLCDRHLEISRMSETQLHDWARKYGDTESVKMALKKYIKGCADAGHHGVYSIGITPHRSKEQPSASA